MRVTICHSATLSVVTHEILGIHPPRNPCANGANGSKTPHNADRSRWVTGKGRFGRLANPFQLCFLNQAGIPRAIRTLLLRLTPGLRAPRSAPLNLAMMHPQLA